MKRAEIGSRRVVGSIMIAAGCACALGLGSVLRAGTAAFVRGDVDGNREHELTDAVQIVSYLFLGSEGLECADAADVDDTGALELTDAIYLLNYLFLGGPAPSAPFPDCGVDPSGDRLGCVATSACEVARAPLRLELETSGGFAGQGTRDVRLEDDVLTVHTPFAAPEDCSARLTREDLEILRAALAAVDWESLRDSYRSPENPDCCCDQFIYVFETSFETPGGAEVAARTDWCDGSLLDGLLPDDFLGFLDTLHALADTVGATCSPER